MSRGFVLLLALRLAGSIALEEVGSLPLGRIFAIAGDEQRVYVSNGGIIRAIPGFSIVTDGVVLDMKLRDDLLFVANSAAGVKCLEADTGELVWQRSVLDRAYELELCEDLLVVAGGEQGTMVLDISEPRKPRLASEVKPGAPVLGVGRWLDGGKLVAVACGWKGVVLLDLSQPRAPSIVRKIDTPGYAYDACGRADFVYVADCDALRTYRLNGEEPCSTYRPDENVEGVRIVHKITGRGNRIYLGTSRGYPAARGGLSALDITVPSKPTPLWEPETTWASDVEISADLLLVAHGIHGWSIYKLPQGKRAYFVGPSPTYAFAKRVILVGDYAYIPTSDYGSYIVQIKEPSRLRVVGSFAHTQSGLYMVVRGNRLFTFGGKLCVSNISDPREPAPLGTASPCGTGKALTERYAFGANIRAGLNVIDISDPRRPLRVAHLNMHYTTDTLFMNGYLFATDHGGFIVIDISKIEKYIEDAVKRGSKEAQELARETLKLLFPKDEGKELRELTRRRQAIRPAELPGSVKVGMLARGGGGFGLYGDSSRNLIYMINFSGKVRVCDVSDVRRPKIISTFATYARDLALHEKLVIVADASYGIRVYDLSVPSEPIEVGSYPTDQAWGVACRYPYIFVADGDMGLRILRIRQQGSRDQVVPTKRPEALIQTHPIFKGGPMWYFGGMGGTPYRSIFKDSEWLRTAHPRLVIGLSDMRKCGRCLTFRANGSNICVVGGSVSPFRDTWAEELSGGKLILLGRDSK